MDALPNADTVEKQSTGFAPTAFPKAIDSRTGVSVEYIRDSGRHRKWYVFRASYGRSSSASDYLIQNGIYVYSPKIEKAERRLHGVKTFLVDLLPNFVFAYITPAEARRVISGQVNDGFSGSTAEAFQTSAILSYYYNHCTTDEFGKNPPLTITEQQMESFIIATSTHDPNILDLEGKAYTYKSDDEVVVVGGKFKGVHGRVVRVNRQQRVLIELSGFKVFATAYIPSAFIRKCGRS